ncbi:MAG: dTMP kinase [Prochloraceae cyanobacterium]
MKGLFIVLEGIDGSGTSTQASLLNDYFLNNNKKVILSPEPSSGPIGNLIRQIMKKRVILTENKPKFDEQMAYLFAADRHDHLYNDIDGVFKLINEGCHVISTRYYFSSLAYNCQTQADWDFIKSLNQRFPNPDLVIYIDLPVEISLQRLRDRPQKEIYETKDKLIQVSQNYRDIFAEYTGLLLQVNGTQSKEEIYQKIVTFITNKLNF